MKKRWELSFMFVIILLWNGCGNGAAQPQPDLPAPSVDVSQQSTVESEQKPTESGSSLVTPTDIQQAMKDTLPDYNPEEILCQTGGVVIPWGDSVSVDMDGDGREEIVSMRLTLDSERSGNDWHEALPVLTVDEAVFGEEDFHQLCYPEVDRGGGFGSLGWCIVDIDTSDSYFEIAVEYWRQNAKTCFLRYGKGEFSYIGSIETNLLALEIVSLPVREESEWEVPWEPDWEAARSVILNADNGLRMDGIPGDGTIHLGAYHNILETLEYGEMTWRLEKPDDLHAELILDPEYLDYGEPERNVIPGLKELERDTVFYKNKGGEDGETVTLPAGTEVWFRRYYPEGRWMEMTYDEGGIYEEGRQSAWFQVVEEVYENMDNQYGIIRLPEGEIPPIDCFGGAYIWGG